MDYNTLGYITHLNDLWPMYYDVQFLTVYYDILQFIHIHSLALL